MIAARDAFLDAIRRGDRQAAFRSLDDALDSGIGLNAIYVDVVQPSMREIGRLWQANELSIGTAAPR